MPSLVCQAPEVPFVVRVPTNDRDTHVYLRAATERGIAADYSEEAVAPIPLPVWHTWLWFMLGLFLAVAGMGAYNALYGQPCCASELLLTKILRDRWKFEGFVVSDCGANTVPYQ